MRSVFVVFFTLWVFCFPIKTFAQQPIDKMDNLIQIADQDDVRNAFLRLHTTADLQSLNAEQRDAVSLYINALVAAVYALTFEEVMPQRRGLVGNAEKNWQQQWQEPWQQKWQTIRSLLLGGSVNNLYGIRDILSRLNRNDKSQSLVLAVRQVDNALLRLKSNSGIRTEQLLFRLNALYIVLEGQVAPALAVNLDFSGRKIGQEEVQPDVEFGPEEETVVEEEQSVKTAPVKQLRPRNVNKGSKPRS